MSAIRSAFFYFGVLAATLVAVGVVPVAACLPRRPCYQLLSFWNVSVLWSAKVFCGISCEVHGRENIPESGPYMLMANHQSAFETVLLVVLLPQPAFVLKRSLLWIPVIGWGLALTRPIVIDRSSPVRSLKRLLQQAQKRFARGDVVVIFPEGTRLPVGERRPYQAGGAHIATRSRVPVLPMAHNAGHFWPRGFLKKPGKVTVRIGPPIPTEELQPAQLNERVREWIEAEGARLSPPM